MVESRLRDDKKQFDPVVGMFNTSGTAARF
jgi:hypothetical protein